MGRKKKQYVNPFSNESNTAEGWAKTFRLKGAKIFCQRVSRWGINDKRTWMTADEAADHRGPKERIYVTNPITGERLPLRDHAKRIGISHTTLATRIKEFGENDPAVWSGEKRKPGPRKGSVADRFGTDEWRALDDTEKSMRPIDEIPTGSCET